MSDVNDARRRGTPSAAQSKPRDFEVELISARAIHKKAVNLLRAVSLNVQGQAPLDYPSVVQCAQLIHRSLERNPDALICVGRLRSPENYLFEHSVNVALLLGNFARFLGMKSGMVSELIIGGLLHDIGMMLIPANIREKTDRLSDEEFRIVRQNPLYGESLLRDLPDLPPMAVTVATQNFENYDGSGYPYGLQKKAISVYGRMTAVVNAYDAMTVDRLHRSAKAPAAALKTLVQQKNTRFDPEVVTRFISCMGVFPVGSLVQLQSGRIGFVMQLSRRTRQPAIVRTVFNLNRMEHLSPEDVWLESRLGAPPQDTLKGPFMGNEKAPSLNFELYI
ncbi:HD-GYP domain-containing protein [Pokkaliibacter sp. CJK22405]|uniref:HD-GYP domain-containing protein n=1 Tax=Pokkaliibacter sp. CJK22405 TaxID=3384615 RepID=UPI0039847153